MGWTRDMPALTRPHKYAGAAMTWALGPAGIGIGGAAPAGTAGEPLTVRRIWEWFGPAIRTAARTYAVPVELLVATIATESAGGMTDRDSVVRSRREEPRWTSDDATPDQVSVGCMQTLIGTARDILRRPDLTAADLEAPETSIDAGAAYIAGQAIRTGYDPPAVAAAYNAGGVYADPAAANRWHMRCYPLGTGAHIDRFVAWFNDAMALPEAVALAEGAPSMRAWFLPPG